MESGRENLLRKMKRLPVCDTLAAVFFYAIEIAAGQAEFPIRSGLPFGSIYAKMFY